MGRNTFLQDPGDGNIHPVDFVLHPMLQIKIRLQCYVLKKMSKGKHLLNYAQQGKLF